LVFAICRSSFRSLSAIRLFPRVGGRKQLRLAVGVIILAAAACGGEDNAAAEVVSGTGYRFEAPADWVVERSGRTLSVAPTDGEAAISVTSFRLARPYRPRLRRQTEAELDEVAERLAGELGGTVERRATITIAGRTGREYRFAGASDETRRIGFVLSGRREYQLLCRGNESGAAACERLFATFRLT
jgi:hypothetical protein